MSQRAKVHLILHLATGMVFLLMAALLGVVGRGAFRGSGLQFGAIAAGVVAVAIGVLVRPGRLARVSDGLCLSFLAFSALFAALEFFFRLIGFDFAHEEQNWRKTPLYFRQPIFPTGEVYFRRGGPEQWTGQTLNAQLSDMGILPNPYHDEPVVTLKYDATGFRHEEGYQDWEIAIAGDSFTELGYLAYDQLFTTMLGKQLKARVQNLGSSFTGPLTQLSYLRDYGLAPSTKRVVIVFFEGNDLTDLQGEYSDLMRFRQTGERPLRELKKRPSLARAIYKLFDAWRRPKPKSWVTAYFKSSHGDIPISMGYAPPGEQEIPRQTREELEYFFEQFAAFGKEHRVEPWLAFMPCKERVVHGMVEFAPDAPTRYRRWQPSDLPQVIGGFTQRHAIRFMDFTPALVEETRTRRELLYNSIYDTHVNALGSAVVAREMARALDGTNSPRNF